MAVNKLPLAEARTYENAIKILNSRRRQRRPDNIVSPNAQWHELEAPTAKVDRLKGLPSIAGMQRWLSQLGHESADINRLNIIHVAGTKGKGSTCAFTESFLRAYGRRTGFPSKTGLYTSPHLIYPEERIRINFRPISRDLFAKYFFEVWTSLSQGKDEQLQPRYLQLIALTAFHAFVREKVEATIIETHHGGEYDATNFIEAPVVSMITALGMDHVQQLGPTLEDIAWHKSGIFKSGAHGLSASQGHDALKVLRQRAQERATDLEVVSKGSQFPSETSKLTPDVQQANCSLALAGAKAFIHAKNKDQDFPLLPRDVIQGIDQFEWPGRFQTKVFGSSRWHLDAAHNEMSMVKAAEWFSELSRSTEASQKVVIFGHVSTERDAQDVSRQLAQSLRDARIENIVLTHYSPHNPLEVLKEPTPTEADLAALKEFSKVWQSFHPLSQITITHNVQDAMATAQRIGTEKGGMQTLVTGSQHLVGRVLFYLENLQGSRQSDGIE